MGSYRKRIADALLTRKLAGMGAVLVEGAKWCGKTTTCEQFAKSAIYLADPQKREEYLNFATVDTQRILDGPPPRLIDEWQDAPQLWDAIRHYVDHSEGEGHFILTGSSVVPKDKEEKIVHSGTGRIARIKMRPMSLWESGESTGELSLGDLMAGQPMVSAKAHPYTLDSMAYLICRGGWPKAVEQGGDIALDRAFDYYEAVTGSDISRTDGIPRDPERVKLLMRSYARLQGTQSNLSTIRKDMQANDTRSIDEDTIHSYLTALRRIFVIEDMRAWCPSLRAKSAIRTSDTRYFTDPSIAIAALGSNPSMLANDLRSFGYFFEALAVRDLRIYMDAVMGHVERYHDSTGLECDAVLQARDGSYALVEIKTGGNLIDEGIETLTKFGSLIAKKKMRPPVFRMVLTAIGEFAYTRPKDNIIICPIGCLKP